MDDNIVWVNDELLCTAFSLHVDSTLNSYNQNIEEMLHKKVTSTGNIFSGPEN